MGKIESWAFRPVGDGFTAPECIKIVVTGNLPGRLTSGNDYIQTSRVVKIMLSSRKVETSNSVYRLGKMDKGYRAWMRKQGYTLKKFVEKAKGKRP